MELEQQDIHYRIGGKLTHCGTECLPKGKDIERIVIARIEYKDSEVINGRKESGVWIAHFAPNPYTSLPFVLNSTNRKRLAKMYPECEGYLARLQNVAVRLTKEETRDVQDGGTTWGLRISKLPPAEAAPEQPQAPAQHPATEKKVVTDENVQTLIDWAKEGKKTFADVASLCNFASDELRKKVADALDDLPA